MRRSNFLLINKYVYLFVLVVLAFFCVLFFQKYGFVDKLGLFGKDDEHSLYKSKSNKSNSNKNISVKNNNSEVESCLENYYYDQSTDVEYGILLKNRQFKPKANRDQAFSCLNLLSSNYYLFLQTYDIPDNKVKEELKKQGVELFDYLPTNTYYAKIDKKYLTTTLHPIIRWLGVIRVDDKLSEDIRSGKFPSWVVSGDKVVLGINFIDKESFDNADQLLGPFNVLIRSRVSTIETVYAEVSKDDVFDIAKLNSVIWLEFPMPPLKILEPKIITN